MLIIPAIDLKDGQCVRLKQGLMDEATVFPNTPAAQAAHWLEQGARRLHVVDLNGAFAGKPKNASAIKDIVKAIGDEIPIQLGGGIRDLDTIERCLDDGVTCHCGSAFVIACGAGLALFIKVFPAVPQDNRFWIALLLPVHAAFALAIGTSLDD